jgi:hypothetical protein
MNFVTHSYTSTNSWSIYDLDGLPSPSEKFQVIDVRGRSCPIRAQRSPRGSVSALF